MESLISLFGSLPRQGPGSDACTRKALDQVRHDLPSQARILDLGCGSGAQTQVLHQVLPGSVITALDREAYLLDKLRERFPVRLLDQQIIPVQADMNLMDFADQSFDLVWSEGAIYQMGFEKALTHIHRLLKPDGFLVFSHLTWLTEQVSPAADQYWQAHYPEMNSLSGNMILSQRHGFEVLDTLILPETNWWSYYYDPLLEQIEKVKAIGSSFASSEDLKTVLEEIEIYRQYGAEYGYVFYALQKIEKASD